MKSYGTKRLTIKYFENYLFSRVGPILFLLYFNDFGNCFSALILQMTLSYFLPEIEQGLNFDLVNISNYFCENELVINLEPGKTEPMLCSKCYQCQNKKPLNLNTNQTVVSTAEYKYL